MIGLGFLGFAWGSFMPAFITSDWDFGELLVPQMFRGVSLMLMMIPINNLALGTLPPERLKNASGLFNVTRNLGGAVGLAIINTMLDKRLDLHLARLHEKLRWGDVQAEELLDRLSALYANGADPARMAALQLAALARREASVMALADVFLCMALLFAATSVIAFMMRRPVAPPPPEAAH
jgi:DHA2 family multidrug resistance protein